MNKKVIRTTITLNGDTFSSGGNIATADGFRTLCTIHYGGGSIVPQGEIAIYGMDMANMLKLTRIRWRDMNSMMNTIRVEAGDQGGELATVFEGNITFAYVDMSNAPDVALRITSMTGALEIYRPSPPVTFSGEISVSEAIKVICESMGFRLENNGVPDSLIMRDTTLTDSNMNKIRSLCKRYRIDLYVEGKSISITPQGGIRKGRIAVASPSSGMIGYPIPTARGIDIRSLYNPDIVFGGLVRVKDSIIDSCNGDWRVFGVTLSLESEMPGGNWFMDIQATYNEPGNAPINR